MHHPDADAPSPHIVRWAHLVPRGGEVLDVAAGHGRHTRFFAARGHPVTAVDRDITALQRLALPGAMVLAADLEAASWPLPGRTFDAVVVTNYLWRPLLPVLVASVATGGVLLYETFAAGHEQFGRPRRPEFLLQPRELLDAVRGQLEVREYFCGPDGDPVTAVRQRLCAMRVGSG